MVQAKNNTNERMYDEIVKLNERINRQKILSIRLEASIKNVEKLQNKLDEFKKPGQLPKRIRACKKSGP